MRRNGYLCTSGVNLDTAVWFADPDFLLGCKISAIWHCFTLIFAFNILIVRHIFTSALFDILTIHCRVTAFLSADRSRDLVTLTFNLLTLSSCHTWRVTWSTLPPSLKTLWLFVHELRVITFPIDYHRKCVTKGSKAIIYLESPTPMCLFTIELLLGYDDD